MGQFTVGLCQSPGLFCPCRRDSGWGCSSTLTLLDCHSAFGADYGLHRARWIDFWRQGLPRVADKHKQAIRAAVKHRRQGQRRSPAETCAPSSDSSANKAQALLHRGRSSDRVCIAPFKLICDSLAFVRLIDAFLKFCALRRKSSSAP